MSTVKLKRLKINQYRNVRPGTELHFDDGVNLVLGQNGSGKTTLLGLLSMVCSWYFEDLEYEEFSIEFEMHRENSRVHCALNNHRTTSASGKEETLAYEFRLAFGTPEVQFHGTPSVLTVIAAGSEAQATPCSPFKHDFLWHLGDAPAQHPALPVARRWVLALDLRTLRLGTPYRFDEGLGCFYALTGEAAPTPTPAGLTATAVGVRLHLDLKSAPARVILSRPQGPFGIHHAVLHEIFAAANPTWDPFTTIPGEQVSFLDAATRQLGFASATLRLANATASGPLERHKVSIGGLGFLFMRQDRTSIGHEHLSYGQKRLLAYYYYLACNDAFVIADELVNGLHHRWIDACMQAIGERQAFLTSQNPLLFDYVEFDSIEQVQARFITCKSEIVDGAEQLVWQNMPRADAARFYEAYTDEIEQVGEILITRGLW